MDERNVGLSHSVYSRLVGLRPADPQFRLLNLLRPRDALGSARSQPRLAVLVLRRRHCRGVLLRLTTECRNTRVVAHNVLQRATDHTLSQASVG